MFKRILVPLDGSPASAQALPYAVEIAKRFGAELILLNVVEATTTSSGGRAPAGVGTSSAVTEIAEEAVQAQNKKNVASARRYLANKLNSALERGIKGSYHVLTGTPAKAILEFCRNEKVDLVVLTTSGKGGIKRAIWGSVADQLIRDPDVPELVIRPGALRSQGK